MYGSPLQKTVVNKNTANEVVEEEVEEEDIARLLARGVVQASKLSRRMLKSKALLLQE